MYNNSVSKYLLTRWWRQ